MYKKYFHENRKQAYNKCLLSFLASNANISLKTKKIIAYFLIINIQFVVLPLGILFPTLISFEFDQLEDASKM